MAGAEYAIPVGRPEVTPADREAVLVALESGWLSGVTEPVGAFERALAEACEVEFAVAVNSGTTACGLMIEASGVGPGEEIVVPAMTIIATIVHGVRMGVKFTCVDVDEQTWCADPEDMIAAATPATRAFLPVHLYGLTVDCRPLLAYAQRAGMLVLEDAAEAIGVTQWGRPCGGLGDAAAVSLYANKSVTCGEGGAVLTNDAAVATRVASLRDLSFGRTERFVHEGLGYGARLSGIAAALASSQLARLAGTTARKRALGARYQAELSGHPWLQLPAPRTPSGENGYWVFGIVLTSDCPHDARGLTALLAEAGIQTRRFFCPLPDQPALRALGTVRSGDLPVARRLWERGLYLPSGVGTTDAEIDRVCEALWQLIR